MIRYQESKNMRCGWILCLCVSCICLSFVGLGCGGGPPRGTTPAADVVATFKGGEVSFTEVLGRGSVIRTPACRTARQAAGGGSADQLVPCYREAAEALVLERLVLAEVDDADRAVESLGQPYFELRRQAYLIPFYQRLGEQVEVGEDEIRAYFEENRTDFDQPAHLTLYNIFRRHRDGGTVEETEAFLRELKERYLTGEPFGALARQYSESETQLRDGLVGQVSKGRLPPRLEEVAFGLAEGEVSDPIRVRGGAVLLHVRNIAPSVAPELAAVRDRIHDRLAARKVEELVDRQLAGKEPPEGSLVLGPDALVAALDDADPQRVVLEMNGETLTVAQLLGLAGLPADDVSADLDETDRERIQRVYENRSRQQLQLADLLENGDPELRREAETHIRDQGLPELVDERLRHEMETLVDGDPELLRQYFDDNRGNYQSPLRFKLSVWDLPFAEDPTRQLEQMNQLRRGLSAGELDLAEAAARLGGEVKALGWRTFDELAEEVPNKARAYLLAGESPFSIPYQQDEALHVLWIEDREEPAQLGYEDVAPRVREDYLARFRQRLSREVSSRWLEEAEFDFREKDVRRLLAPDSAEGASRPRD